MVGKKENESERARGRGRAFFTFSIIPCAFLHSTFKPFLASLRAPFFEER